MRWENLRFLSKHEKRTDFWDSMYPYLSWQFDRNLSI